VAWWHTMGSAWPSGVAGFVGRGLEADEKAMTFELRAVGRSKLSDAIVDQILEGIRSGAFGPGTVLPPERSLAERFGVSRGSVREAIRSLEYAGILNVRTGSGTYVAEGGVSKAAALRAYAALVGEHSPLDLLVARCAIEPVCAGLAAANRSESDLEHLRQLVDAQRELLVRGEETAEVDLSFHVAVASAGHNPVLLMLYDRIAEIMRQATWRELRRRSRATAGTPELYLSQHEATLAAIERGDSAAARRSVEAHVHAVEERLVVEVESRP
jgi:GntR family transcriptional regulator, transcriptional repressor for pyruvate dehydrogenase complex